MDELEILAECTELYDRIEAADDYARAMATESVLGYSPFYESVEDHLTELLELLAS